MKTVKLYTMECTKAFSIHEQGSSYSLNPWGENTTEIDGYDDGGKDYDMPDGFEVCEMSITGGLGIFQGDTHIPIIENTSGRPALIAKDGQEICLKKSQ